MSRRIVGGDRAWLVQSRAHGAAQAPSCISQDPRRSSISVGLGRTALVPVASRGLLRARDSQKCLWLLCPRFPVAPAVCCRARREASSFERRTNWQEIGPQAGTYFTDVCWKRGRGIEPCAFDDPLSLAPPVARRGRFSAAALCWTLPARRRLHVCSVDRGLRCDE